jgi:putative oxidoreductase
MLQLALAITATILEGSLGVLLLVGLFTRSAAVATSVLLLSFAAAMTISLGIKPVLDYSVLSALCGALFLAAEDRYPLSIDALLTFEIWRPSSWKQLKQ